MRRFLKWVGIVLLVCLVLILLAGASLYALSSRKLSRTYVVPPEAPLTISSDSATIARGAYLVSTLPCAECHAEDLGGRVFADAGPFGLLVGPNLTRGRGGRTPPLTDAEWELAIRHGVRRGGTSLIVMPSEVFTHVSDAEMGPMIAYLKQVPPVDREVPPTKLRIVGRLLLGAGQLPLAADTTPKVAHATSVDTTTGAAYGRYLVTISGCEGCHGASLSGAPAFGPDMPPASNITPTGIGKWTEADFLRAMRQGVRPDGSQIKEVMPWKAFGRRGDGELRSIWMYLQTVPAKAFQET
ncbi:MAG TPA: c-type cytochrome [Gemmatimonadaceae bacterium]|nr:c-type cytochrome [Gemmatimonadaceae bacterium]